MPGNFKKEDLRITKTIMASKAALLTMLNTRNFSRITVHDLCEEALISRATFYAHFYDKYDLLKYTLTMLLNDIVNNPDKYFDVKKINQIIQQNSKIIKNTVENADHEVLEQLHIFLSSVLEAFLRKKSTGKEIRLEGPDYLILSNFFSGGMINLLQWQVINKFPPDNQMINAFLFGLLEYIAEWYTKQTL